MDRRKWWILAIPNEKFDSDVVMEFYANAYPLDEGGEELAYKTWVRGKTVLFDRDTINDLLGNPYDVTVEPEDEYHWMLQKSRTLIQGGFSPGGTASELCIPRKSYSSNAEGQPKRIYRKHMTSLAQLWMIFLLHNVIPNSHVSSLPLVHCHLLYTVMQRLTIDVAGIIAKEMFKTVVRVGKKGCGSDQNRKAETSYHFALCPSKLKEESSQQQGLESNPPPPPPQSEPSQQPPLPYSAPPPELSIPEQLQRLTMHMEHLELQNEILRQGQVFQQQGLFAAFQSLSPGNQFWGSTDTFTQQFPWPGVRPNFPEGAGTSGHAAGEADDAQENANDAEEGVGEEDTDDDGNWML
ncbi:hypothetical protein Lal_00039259 [Lupinus albus]|nr:hypothetical protein Lal_00039259 [Lupinus albus]